MLITRPKRRLIKENAQLSGNEKTLLSAFMSSIRGRDIISMLVTLASMDGIKYST